MNIGFPPQTGIRFNPGPAKENPFQHAVGQKAPAFASDRVTLRFGAGNKVFNPLQTALLNAFGLHPDLSDGNMTDLRTGFAKFLIRQEAKEILAVKQNPKGKEKAIRAKVQQDDWTELSKKVESTLADAFKELKSKKPEQFREAVENMIFMAMEYTPKNAEAEMFQEEYITETAMSLGLAPHKASTDDIIEKLEAMDIPKLEAFIRTAL